MHNALCTFIHIVRRFKKSLDVAKQWPVADRVSTGVVKQFNCTVLDFCNALWRCLVFTEEQQSLYESLAFPFSRFGHCKALLYYVMLLSISEYLATTCKISNPSERLHITQHIALLGYVIGFPAKVCH